MTIGRKIFLVIRTISVMFMVSESLTLSQLRPSTEPTVSGGTSGVNVETKVKRWRPYVCELTSKSAPCDYNLKESGYYFDNVNKICVQFDKSKCGRNANSFKTIEECETWCGDGGIIKRRKSIKIIM